MARRLGVTVDPAQVAACVGTKELVAGAAAVAAPAHGPTATPCSTRPISYPTYAMGATLAGLPGGAATRDARLDAIDPADAARALCLWVEHARQPHRRARRPRRGGRVGPGARRAGALRRVLRRVHLGRAAPHDPRARRRRRARRALAVEALEPGRRRGPASTPATPTSSRYLARGAQARRVHGARPGAGGRRRGLGRRRPRRRAARALPRAASRRCAPRWPPSASTRRCPPAPSTCGSPAPDGDAWALARRLAERRRRARVAGRVLRPGGAGHVRIAVVQPDDRIAWSPSASRRLA